MGHGGSPPPGCAWPNAATVRKTPGQPQLDMLREPALGETTQSSLGTEWQPQQECSCVISFTHLKAGPRLPSHTFPVPHNTHASVCQGARILNKLNYTSCAQETASPRKRCVRNRGFKPRVSAAFGYNRHKLRTPTCCSTASRAGLRPTYSNSGGTVAASSMPTDGFSRHKRS